MKKTIVKKNSPVFKISTNDIKAEFNTDSKSVFNKVMDFFGLTFRDSDHLNFYRDENNNNAFEVFMTKDECLAFADTYGHERKRAISKLIKRLEKKYNDETALYSSYDKLTEDQKIIKTIESIKPIIKKIETVRMEYLDSIENIQKQIEELTNNHDYQLTNLKSDLNEILETLTR